MPSSNFNFGGNPSNCNSMYNCDNCSFTNDGFLNKIKKKLYFYQFKLKINYYQKITWLTASKVSWSSLNTSSMFLWFIWYLLIKSGVTLTCRRKIRLRYTAFRGTFHLDCTYGIHPWWLMFSGWSWKSELSVRLSPVGAVGRRVCPEAIPILIVCIFFSRAVVALWQFVPHHPLESE